MPYPNDADLEMRALEERARAAARRDGKCSHGWRKGAPGPGVPKGSDVQTCLDCGKVATQDELDADAAEIFAEY